MPITLTCDECSKTHRVDAAMAGECCECQGCGKLLLIEKSPASTAEFADFVDDLLDDDQPNETRRAKPGDRPVRPPGKLVCKFYASNSISVDFATNCFVNCLTPRKFLAVTSLPEFRCPLADLRAVHRLRMRDHSEMLTIVTRTGKATVPSSAVNFEPLERCLRANLPDGGLVVSADHPLWVPICALSGALCGLLAGLFLTAKNAPDGVFVRNLLLGMMAGILIVLLPIKLAQWSDSDENS